ncbi:hypothetical protein BDB01DRAFT_771984 [Pilobolus umbonatus]|nr:hypothetical protein BDB01DRAFT_771984 [Pilobolus umbonatus]
MNKSFGDLLRHSRLASYDRTLEQVYTSPEKFRKIGDWGLKRNLPTVIRTKNLVINQLDTAEHQTPWESGEGKILFIKRWKENFPNSHKPASRSEEVQYNIIDMTPAEFQRFLKRSSKQAKEFQELLAKKEVTADQVYDYLKINFSETTDNKSNNGVVGPTYSDYEIGWDYPVQGRILNNVAQGHAVGIGGIVALLVKRNAIGLRNSGDRKIRTFYVNNAELDEQGKPRVVISLQSKNASSSIPLLNNYENYDTFNKNNRFRNNDMSVDDMMNTKHRRQTPEIEDNITPNPEHTDLMSRIAMLLDSTKEKH